jgi:formylglycine-generating enzyme required for sulfatase activity
VSIAIAVAAFAAVFVLGGVGVFFARGALVARGGSGARPSGAAASAPSVPPASSSAPVSVAPVAAECPKGMLAIPGGRFFMGSDDREDLDIERPAHQVTVAPFCIDEFEVTTAEYKACSDAGECKRAGRENEWPSITTKERAAFDPLCNGRDAEGKAKHPINCVAWDMAVRFCEHAGKRLPTEAEWEFAARGPDGRRYPWGDETPTAGHLNACGKECIAWGKAHGQSLSAMYDADDGYPNTAPVGSFPQGRSRYGVQDVVGNVWEWTADYFADYTNDDQVDPKGPPSGERRVIRGGAWNGAQPSWVRPTFRYHDVPTTRSYGIGFRCAKAKNPS